MAHNKTALTAFAAPLATSPNAITQLRFGVALLFHFGFLSAAGSFKPSLQIRAGASAGKLPYGVAIAIGTIGYLVLHQLGFL